MSYESDECKLLIDEAIHDYLHDDTETEMTVKDWFYDLRKQATKADEYEAKAKAYDDTLKTLDKLINDDERYKEARSNDFVAGMLLAYEKTSILMEDYIKENGGYDAKK